MNPFIPCSILLACLTACDGAGPEGNGGLIPEDRLPLVRVAPVELRMVQREIETTSFLESEHRVTVLSEVPGKVIRVLVDEGGRVRAGQELALLDDREARSAVARMQIQLQSRHVEKSLSQLEVEAAGRRVQQAVIERDQAKAEWERNAGIAREVVSPKVLEESRFAYEASEEALLVAQFNEKKAILEVDRAGTAIAEAEADLEEAGLYLERHRIAAPMDGVIEMAYIKGGETINSASTELFVVLDPGNLVAYLNRPQRELALVRDAREVRFTTDTYPGQEFTADVELVSPVIDQTTGSFRLRVRVRDPGEHKLLPGMFIRARILTEELREALMVPKTAVLSELDTAVVFAVRDGRATRIALDPGLEAEEWVECRNRGDDGLRSFDRVIVVGHEDLKDQAQVEVAKD